jgi:NAD(P)-dependent dehydrogenase (short-subunit alcohol dehydrogenase family)
MVKPVAMQQLFDLSGRVTIITGGAGLLGYQHALAVAGLGAIPVLIDISQAGLETARAGLFEETGVDADIYVADITRVEELQVICDQVVKAYGHIDILINNAARNPKVESADGKNFSRLENFPWEQWRQDLDVGLGGAFNCAKVFGAQMASQGKGVIINIASDLGVIAPDQRLYRIEGCEEDQQPVKPVTYSVVKHGLIGLTKYLATYWCDQGVRCNAVSPGGVYAGQNDGFVSKLTTLIPLGRMADKDEYRGAIAFLCSDASSYMNGGNLVMDGGRSVW